MAFLEWQLMSTTCIELMSHDWELLGNRNDWELQQRSDEITAFPLGMAEHDRATISAIPLVCTNNEERLFT
jgi:hypothetical protein